MKRRLSIVAFVAVTLLSALLGVTQSLNQDTAGDILASAYGPRIDTTLTNIITQIGTRQRTLILDGGPWVITNVNVSFPTNVSLYIARGASLSVASGKTGTILGEFLAGHYPVFSGGGTVTGSASFLYRIGTWGPTNTYRIGTGDIEAWGRAHVATREWHIRTTISNNYTALTNAITNAYEAATGLTYTLVGGLSNYVDNSITQQITTYITDRSMTRVTNDMTINIASTCTLAQIKTQVLAYHWVDQGKTLTIDFANGNYSFAGSLDFFDDYGGPGAVHVIGNVASPSSCKITISSTSYDGFKAEDGGAIDLLDGFTLVGSGTNSATHMGVAALRAASITCGANMVVTNFGTGFRSQNSSYIDARWSDANKCQIGYYAIGNGYMLADASRARWCQYGYYVDYMGSIRCIGGTSRYANVYGFAAVNQSFINAQDSLFTNNTADFTPGTNAAGNANAYIYYN